MYKRQPVPLAQIAKRQHISDGYLEQLMIPLKAKRLVKSVRGAQGGYLLSRPPEEISVLDVISALEAVSYTHLLLYDSSGEQRKCLGLAFPFFQV